MKCRTLVLQTINKAAAGTWQTFTDTMSTPSEMQR